MKKSGESQEKTRRKSGESQEKAGEIHKENIRMSPESH